MQRTGQTRYMPNGHQREMNRGPSGVPSAATNSLGVASRVPAETLSSMLASASPEDQKNLLGDRLYPLVQKHKVQLLLQHIISH